MPNSIEIWQTFRDAYSSVGDLRQDRRRRGALGRRPTKVDRARRPVLTGRDDDRDARPRRRTRRHAPPGWRPCWAASRWASLFAAPYAVFLAAGLRLPARAGGVDQLPRLLLRRARARRSTGRSSGSTTTRAVLGDPDVRRVVRATSLMFLVINVPLTVVLSLVLADGAQRRRSAAAPSCGSPTSCPT